MSGKYVLVMKEAAATPIRVGVCVTEWWVLYEANSSGTDTVYWTRR